MSFRDAHWNLYIIAKITYCGIIAKITYCERQSTSRKVRSENRLAENWPSLKEGSRRTEAGFTGWLTWSCFWNFQCAYISYKNSAFWFFWKIWKVWWLQVPPGCWSCTGVCLTQVAGVCMATRRERQEKHRKHRHNRWGHWRRVGRLCLEVPSLLAVAFWFATP